MRIGPGPTARVSATHHSSESQDRSCLANRTGMLDTCLSSQLHLGVLYSEGSHTTQPCLASTQKGPVYCRELGMGNVHPIQACGLWASRRKGTAASSQAGSITRACQQAGPSNKSCGTRACVCCVDGAAEGGTEGGTLWSSRSASAKGAAECCLCKRSKPVGPPKIFVVEARFPYGEVRLASNSTSFLSP